MNKIIVFILVLFGLSCGGGDTSRSNDTRETAKKGTFKMIVDESFKPVIDLQLEVFKSAYPDVKVEVEYKTETDCFRMLDTDSATRLIITSRRPTADEEKHFNEKFERGISHDAVAMDAVAVIVHPSSKNTMLTLSDLKDALLGKSKYGFKPVFDGNKETSNARFIRDSILKIDTMPEAVSGVKGNQAVVDYVSRNPNALGFVGVSWVGNPDDASQFSFVKTIKVAGIQCQRGCPAYAYPQPFQARIANRNYPLVRGIYYTVKNDYGGVASNFAKWLELERGQLIFNKAYLVGIKQKVLLKYRDAETK